MKKDKKIPKDFRVDPYNVCARGGTPPTNTARSAENKAYRARRNAILAKAKYKGEAHATSVH